MIVVLTSERYANDVWIQRIEQSTW